jgi:hypothetical protein
MHVQFSTALVIVAVVSSLVLVLNRGDRLFPVIAAVASALEALIVFGVITLSLGKFRIDVILPGIIVLAAAMCWARSSDKPTTTASTALLAVGMLQLLFALSLLT